MHIFPSGLAYIVAQAPPRFNPQFVTAVSFRGR
jgi:hypothetical protein